MVDSIFGLEFMLEIGKAETLSLSDGFPVTAGDLRLPARSISRGPRKGSE